MFALAIWLLLSPNPLGAAAFTQGDFALAEKFFLAAWQLQPHANVASNLGAVSRRLDKWPEAERWFNTVLTLRRRQLGPAHPDTVIALSNRGVARLQLDRLREARADFELALTLVKPGTVDQAAILANASELALRQARLRAAQQLCATARRLDMHAAQACRAHLSQVALSVDGSWR